MARVVCGSDVSYCACSSHSSKTNYELWYVEQQNISDRAHWPDAPTPIPRTPSQPLPLIAPPSIGHTSTTPGTQHTPQYPTVDDDNDKHRRLILSTTSTSGPHRQLCRAASKSRTCTCMEDPRKPRCL
ncbi:hypothetical protein DENSPDRAFT_661095 [Dentipellis sp. KUC8613]|nr:hypothetical protein DENSPDRAFT_661095 [Dentipellis sp. KUC8613]